MDTEIKQHHFIKEKKGYMEEKTEKNCEDDIIKSAGSEQGKLSWGEKIPWCGKK